MMNEISEVRSAVISLLTQAGFLFPKSTFFADEIDALELNSRKTLNPDGEPGRFY
jgi:hypothetical protein